MNMLYLSVHRLLPGKYVPQIFLHEYNISSLMSEREETNRESSKGSLSIKFGHKQEKLLKEVVVSN